MIDWVTSRFAFPPKLAFTLQVCAHELYIEYSGYFEFRGVFDIKDILLSYGFLRSEGKTRLEEIFAWLELACVVFLLELLDIVK